MKNELRVDFYFPVLDAVAESLNSRFNSECTTVMKLISRLCDEMTLKTQ